MNTTSLAKALIIYGIALPLAVFIGYYLADPLSFQTVTLLGLVLLALSLPLIIRFYHPLIVLSWNTIAIIVLLPGAPYLWMVMAYGCILVILFLRAAGPKEVNLLPHKSIGLSLVFLALVVAITALLTGGLKFRALGDEAWGGKRYLTVWAAIAGFFVIASRGIPANHARRYVDLFFLGGLTWFVTSLYAFPSVQAFVYPLYYLFPADPQITTGPVFRVHGVPVACLFVWFWMISRYGVKGIFTKQVWWRIPLALLLLAGTMVGGFRIYLFTYFGILAITFFLEGLHKTSAMIIAGVSVIVLACVVYSTAKFLPLNYQRSLAWLPIPLDPMAKLSAEATTYWRIEMWKDLIDEVPKYLIKGRGFVFNPFEFELARAGFYKGPDAMYRAAYWAGDYHNGPLSVIIPLGIWGAIGFLWFTIASLKWMYFAWKKSLPELRVINSGLLAVYLMKMFVFYALYGHFYQDFAFFTGLLALSISLNYYLLQKQPSTTKLDAE